MLLRVLFVSISLLISVFVSGQTVLRNTSILNYQRGDRTRIHFGFSLGTNVMDYRAVLTGANDLRIESGRLNVGFLVGIITELKITEDLGLRLMPGLEFSTRRMVYTNAPDAPEGKAEALNDHVYITVPLMFKYKAKRINNYRPFITAGPSIKYDFQNHNRINPDRSIYFMTKPMDYFLEMGIGSDFYLPYFKLGVELRFSLGLTDVLKHEYDPENPGYEAYTDAIKKLKARMFTICFHFE
ncbi:PorT family protein [Odoribacter sp. OttesenSCG-928-J03]|nr:PorT family protein [Odoribacter sp. OttesenSCG-928-J03]MDL2283371.1 PorT family protein [Odoribacter sp. OttesenSCG-928-G04]